MRLCPHKYSTAKSIKIHKFIQNLKPPPLHFTEEIMLYVLNSEPWNSNPAPFTLNKIRPSTPSKVTSHFLFSLLTLQLQFPILSKMPQKPMQMSGGAVPIGDAIEPREPQKTRSSLGTLSFTQLYVLVLIVVFSASGLVCLEDMAFVLLSSVYIFIVSKVAFPATAGTSRVRAFGKSRLFTLYVGTGGVVGLFLPLAYIFGGFVEGDKKGVEAAAPHVFLLSCQVFLEGLSFALDFSLPARAMVPVFYNTRRIFTILDWLRADFWKQAEDLDLPSSSSYSSAALWLRFGRALVVANLVFWSFNLFCFLIPVYLPKAFRIYHQKETADANPKNE